MTANKNSNFVEHLVWDEVAARILSGAVAILPVGAGAKQHGLHLPMNTDMIQANALGSRLADQIDALVWPVLSYGYYPAFTKYAGSCSLSSETFEHMIGELVGALLEYGCEVVFVLNTGISTIPPIERALSSVDSPRAHHLKIYDGPRYKSAAQKMRQQGFGSHADELETSLMLALAPHLVDMHRAEASSEIKQDVGGRLTPSNSASPNFSRSGSFGDPTLATLAKGEILLAAMMDDLVTQTHACLSGEKSATRPNTRAL